MARMLLIDADKVDLDKGTLSAGATFTEVDFGADVAVDQIVSAVEQKMAKGAGEGEGEGEGATDPTTPDMAKVVQDALAEPLEKFEGTLTALGERMDKVEQTLEKTPGTRRAPERLDKRAGGEGPDNAASDTEQVPITARHAASKVLGKSVSDITTSDVIDAGEMVASMHKDGGRGEIALTDREREHLADGIMAARRLIADEE